MTSEVPAEGILGLFPSLQPVGGIQASGRLVLDRFFLDRNSHPGSTTSDRNFLFTYGPEGPIAAQRHNRDATHANTKLAAIKRALARQWDYQTIFVWHLHLIRLLPFMRRSRGRVVVMLHGIEAWQRFDRLTNRLLGATDLFVTNSEFTWQRFLAINPELANHPHKTVHLGLGEPLRQVSSVNVEPPVVLMIGRLANDKSEDKGHRAMIHALTRVQEVIPSAELWIVGDGALRPELEQLTFRYRVSHGVRFLGQVSETEKQEALARCRCLALPSRGEGFGLVYLEAMRKGRPSLVSTVDAGREVINPPEAGLAANLDDPDDLANATVRLLRDGDEWQTWSRQARERYEQNFTESHFLDRLGMVLEQQVGKAGLGGIQTCVESPAPSSIRGSPTDKLDGTM